MWLGKGNSKKKSKLCKISPKTQSSNEIPNLAHKNGHRWGLIGYANWIFRNQEAIVILLKSNTNETKENEPETEPKKSYTERSQEKIVEKEPLSENLAENIAGSQSEEVILDQSDQPDQLDVDEIEKDCLSQSSYLNVTLAATKEYHADNPLERG